MFAEGLNWPDPLPIDTAYKTVGDSIQNFNIFSDTITVMFKSTVRDVVAKHGVVLAQW